MTKDLRYYLTEYIGMLENSGVNWPPEVLASDLRHMLDITDKETA
jgi:hypothetical protein